MELVVAAAFATFAGAAASDNGTCVDLLSLPREDESTRCYGEDCTCQISVPEVIWLVLKPLEDGSAGLQHHHRALTPTLGQWIDQGFAFLEGEEPLDVGFRLLWTHLSYAKDVLEKHCPIAAELAALLWSLVSALSACFHGSPMAPEAWEPQKPGNSRIKDAKRALEALCQDDELQRKLVRNLVEDSEETIWSRPFWSPFSLTEPLKDAAEFASASNDAPVPSFGVSAEMTRRALVDFVSLITEVFEEVLPDERTMEVMEQVKQGKVAGPEKRDGPRPGCHVQFYVALGADGLENMQAVAQYLISHQWSCFATDSAETFLSKSKSAAIDCVIYQHSAALRFCLRPYIILDDGQGFLLDEEFRRPFQHWGGLVPRELIKKEYCPVEVDMLCPGTAMLQQMRRVQRGNLEITAAQRSLIQWLHRKAEHQRGNSLCFSQSRQREGFTFDRCCQDPALQPKCFDETMTELSCCQSNMHSCGDLRLHVADWSMPDYQSKEFEVEVPEAKLGPRCMGDDLYRDYFDDVRQHVLQNRELQDGILGTRVEKLVASMSPELMSSSSCPEVALLGRLVILDRMCQFLLQNPLSPEAIGRQGALRDDVEQLVPALRANLEVGYLTLVSQLVLSRQLNGAVGKMYQATHGDSEDMHGVLEPGYVWPTPWLAGQSLRQRGLDCQQGEKIIVGERSQDHRGWDHELFFFADLSNPMPHDGLLSNVRFPFMTRTQERAHVDIILLRPCPGTSNSYERQGAHSFIGERFAEDAMTEAVAEQELYVWRGDVLAFASIGARMIYRNCSSCRVATLPLLQFSHFSDATSQKKLELGATKPRAYSWTAELIPMRCQAASWHAPLAPLPLATQSPPPRSSRAHCSGSSWTQRSCRFEKVCYNVATESFEFYGHSSQDYRVGLSMFSDLRTSWSPRVMEASEEAEASWINVPTYLAMRHAAQNWGHHAVETTLGLYALIMSNEDLKEVHGQRLIFFQDECSLELQGDAIEFCMRFVPKPIKCIQEIPELCAKFTAQLWPLLSDWAPLEKARLPERAPGTRLLCFRSVVAGMAPWRRPIQLKDSDGVALAQQLWAADPLFAPVVRQFQVATMIRLKVERREDPILLASVKAKRRSVQNRQELLDWLAASAGPRRLSFENLDFDLPLKEQARLLAATQLFVASMGSNLMAGVLLSADAAVLALPSCHKVGPGRRVTCETEEILKSCGLRWAQYPVSFDDVLYTIGRGFDFTARREIVEKLIDELLDDG